MNKEKRRVPKLRFPGFTEDWEQCKLEDICSYQSSSLTINDIDKNGQYDLYDANSLIGKTNKGYMKMEYITIIKDGAGVGRTRMLPKNSMFLGTMGALTPKNSYLGFLYQLVTNANLGKICTGSTIPHIYFKDYGKLKFCIPSIIEQEVIGKFFNNIDYLITLHQRKLEHLNLKKKAFLQKLFPKNGERYPELRFPGFTDAWEQRKFGEIYERSSQKNDSTYGIDKIISVANMYFKIDATVGSEEYLKTYNVFKLGDIAFEGHTNKEYSYGRFVENTIGDGIVSHIFDVFTPRINLDINFWKDLIKYEPIMGPILRRCTKASRMMSNLTSKEFLEEKILCPTLEEQKLIGEFIVRIDKNITLHQRKLEHLQLQKKALLQQMFV